MDGRGRVALAFLKLEVKVRRGAEAGATGGAQLLAPRHSFSRFDKRRPRKDMDVLGQEAIFLQDRDLCCNVGSTQGVDGGRACWLMYLARVGHRAVRAACYCCVMVVPAGLR